MDRMLRNKKTILLFLLPSLIIFTATVVIPILWSGYYSLYNWNGIGEMKFVGLDNFKAILKDRHFSNAFSNNLIYLLINLCGQLGIALLLALLLSHLPHGNSFFKTIYFAPAILSASQSARHSRIFIRLTHLDCSISFFRQSALAICRGSGLEILIPLSEVLR